jgi:hypothetical protein
MLKMSWSTLKTHTSRGEGDADLYTPTASLDVFSRCLKRIAMGSSRLVALLEGDKTQDTSSVWF